MLLGAVMIREHSTYVGTTPFEESNLGHYHSAGSNMVALWTVASSGTASSSSQFSRSRSWIRVQGCEATTANLMRMACRKEQLWPHVREFADRGIAHVTATLRRLQEASEPCSLYTIHGETAPLLAQHQAFHCNTLIDSLPTRTPGTKRSSAMSCLDAIL